MRKIVVVVLLLSACTGLTAPAFGQQAADAPLRVGGNISTPMKLKDVQPVYPPEAQRAGISGTVILEAVIGEDGKVRSARVLRSIPLLDEPAINAVREWEYRPVLFNGVAVPVIMTVSVNFVGRGGPAAPLPPPPPPPANAVRLLMNRAPNGQSQLWDIDLTKAASLPRWNQDGDPPVTMADAMRVARTWLSARNPQVPRFFLLNANLSRRPLTPDGDLWFYQLIYSTAPVSSMQSPPLMVIVLFDGSVLEPTEFVPPAAQ